MVEVQSLSSLGQIAEKLTFTTANLAYIMLGACVVVGVFLIVLAIGFYREHRENPKFVPLDKVIMYAILGLLLLAIPFLHYFFAPIGNPLEVQKTKVVIPKHDPDAPIPAPLLPPNMDIDAPLQ